MTLRVQTKVEDGLGTVSKSIVADNQTDWLLMKEFAYRAVNLWPDAPPQIKRIADRVVNGRVMQEYGPDLVLTKAQQEELERKFS